MSAQSGSGSLEVRGRDRQILALLKEVQGRSLSAFSSADDTHHDWKVSAVGAYMDDICA